MKNGGAIGHDLRTLFDAGALGGLSDVDLLNRFLTHRDEPAFEAIVRRHGPMVLGVCRRILRDPHDAEDAFQATFLVLARKAASVRPAAMLPNWLHGVARKTATKARAINGRRRGREKQVTIMPERQTTPEATADDLSAWIDRELSHLPVKYRLPLILCELEGLGHREAALKLGWPVGTVSGRLSRARKMLARRLTRCDRALAPGALAVAFGPEAVPAGVPASLFKRTIEAAVPFSAGPGMATAATSGPVVALADRILGGMMMSQLIATVGAGLAGGLLLFLGVERHNLLAGPAVRATIRPAERVVAAAVAEDPASQEVRRLQGTWQGVDFEFQGKKTDGFQSRNVLMTFEGDEIIMKGVSTPGPGRRSRFKLDPGTTPRAIDITERDRPEPERSQTVACIYLLENDRLTIAYPGNDTRQRPKGFRAAEGCAARRVLERVGPNGPVDPGPRDPTLAGFEVIQRDYDRDKWAFWDAFRQAATADERRKVNAEQQPKPEPFAERFWRLAQQRPNTREELFALCWAALNAPATGPGERALALLENGRLAKADPADLLKALREARTDQQSLPSPLAPLVLQRIERDLDHPAGAELLTWVCANYYGSQWPDEPPTFREAADLLVGRFADRPGIQNFCECLGRVDRSDNPAWADKYERHVRMILAANQDRLVQCMALSALATIARNAGDTRLDEAEALYESFIKRFSDGSNPGTRSIEAMMVQSAKRELTQLRDRKAKKNRHPQPPGAKP